VIAVLDLAENARRPVSRTNAAAFGVYHVEGDHVILAGGLILLAAEPRAKRAAQILALC
jgi:hypothetical protein